MIHHQHNDSFISAIVGICAYALSWAFDIDGWFFRIVIAPIVASILAFVTQRILKNYFPDKEKPVSKIFPPQEIKDHHLN